jgi:chaperonin GroEL
MAAYSGGKVYDPGTIDQFIAEDEEEGFGFFKTAKVNMFESVIISDVDEDKLDARISEIKSILEISKNDHDRFHIKAALGRLTGGISTIWVGGASELEAREKKARCEDAVEAVKSAIAEGVVPGGCSVHLVLSDIIMTHPDKKESWEIMAKALMGPFELLLSNCGEDFDVIYNMLQPHVTGQTKPSQTIFDAESHKLVNASDAGIIEPAKVCRVALGNALSVASLLITLGGIVVVPRDSSLENQLALSKQAFRDMFSGEGVGAQ